MSLAASKLDLQYAFNDFATGCGCEITEVKVSVNKTKVHCLSKKAELVDLQVCTQFFEQWINLSALRSHLKVTASRSMKPTVL